MASRSMRRKKTSERLGRPRWGSAARAVVADDPRRSRRACPGRRRGLGLLHKRGQAPPGKAQAPLGFIGTEGTQGGSGSAQSRRPTRALFGFVQNKTEQNCSLPELSTLSTEEPIYKATAGEEAIPALRSRHLGFPVVFGCGKPQREKRFAHPTGPRCAALHLPSGHRPGRRLFGRLDLQILPGHGLNEKAQRGGPLPGVCLIAGRGWIRAVVPDFIKREARGRHHFREQAGERVLRVRPAQVEIVVIGGPCFEVGGNAVTDVALANILEKGNRREPVLGRLGDRQMPHGHSATERLHAGDRVELRYESMSLIVRKGW